MLAGWTTEFIRAVHDAPGKFVLCITGGGSLAISALLETPGASRSVLEASVPYAAEALVRWLQARPEQFCSESTARAMAMAAYLRAREFAPHDVPSRLAGIGCTASLASDRPKHGSHRIHAALQTSELTLCHSVELTKGARTRAAEEVVAASLVLNLVAEFKALAQRVDAGLQPAEQLRVARMLAPAGWQNLLSGSQRVTPANAAAVANSIDLTDRVIFPGAFHPRHEGHRAMARLATKQTGRPVDHELSIINVDKPPIDFMEMEHRAAQFTANEQLWFTRAPTFAQKAEIFPRATFVVGVDTIARIAAEKYYRDTRARDAALASLAKAGCCFLVFGRSLAGSFQCLNQLKLPDALRQICDEVTEGDFRNDVSSTALRRLTDADSAD